MRSQLWWSGRRGREEGERACAEGTWEGTGTALPGGWEVHLRGQGGRGTLPLHSAAMWVKALCYLLSDLVGVLLGALPHRGAGREEAVGVTRSP